MIIPFGTYSGRKVRDVPDDHLRWLLSVEIKHADLRADRRAAAAARGLLGSSAGETPPTARTTARAASDRELIRRSRRLAG